MWDDKTTQDHSLKGESSKGEPATPSVALALTVYSLNWMKSLRPMRLLQAGVLASRFSPASCSLPFFVFSSSPHLNFSCSTMPYLC